MRPKHAHELALLGLVEVSLFNNRHHVIAKRWVLDLKVRDAVPVIGRHRGVVGL